MPPGPSPSPSAAAEISCETLETFLGADVQVAILRDVVSGDSFPQQVVRRIWLGDLEPVDLDIGERIGFLYSRKRCQRTEDGRGRVGRLTFASAILFNSLMTAWTVAVFPVPGTPEISSGFALAVHRYAMRDALTYTPSTPLLQKLVHRLQRLAELLLPTRQRIRTASYVQDVHCAEPWVLWEMLDHIVRPSVRRCVPRCDLL